MIEFLLNSEDIRTGQPVGMTVLDFVRYHKNLKGTKIGCREGDCGACTILVGELKEGGVRYRTMTSCLMPLANAAGKHIVTVEGINPQDGSLTPVQQAMADENGTQCGFCTVGFVMSLTGFCLDSCSIPQGVSGPNPVGSPHVSKGSTSSLAAAISAIDGNICRCTGYKSIERAAAKIAALLSEPPAVAGGSSLGIDKRIVPKYFATIAERLIEMHRSDDAAFNHQLPQAVLTEQAETRAVASVPFVAGGTDVYVQKPEAMAESDASHILYDDSLRTIRDLGDHIELGASVTVTDLLESPVMNAAFPDLYKHLKLVSSTPIRNMATLAGNFVNASPIGDMTIWFLALNAEIILNSPLVLGGVTAAAADGVVTDGQTNSRTILLKQLYLGYKQLAKSPDEYITAIRFKKPTAEHYFNFEKVSKRTYLDIATVNTAISLKCETLPGQNWTPPALSGASSPPYEGGVDARVFGEQTGWFSQHSDDTTRDNAETSSSGGEPPRQQKTLTPLLRKEGSRVENLILDAHASAGGVAPIPLYLKETSSFLVGRTINEETIEKANEIMQLEISPISDVRGTEKYKRLLLRQLFRAHFHELIKA